MLVSGRGISEQVFAVFSYQHFSRAHAAKGYLQVTKSESSRWAQKSRYRGLVPALLPHACEWAWRRTLCPICMACSGPVRRVPSAFGLQEALCVLYNLKYVYPQRTDKYELH